MVLYNYQGSVLQDLVIMVVLKTPQATPSNSFNKNSVNLEKL